jgi:hypothetical protein
VHFIGYAKLKKVRKETSYEFYGGVTADSGAVGLPKGAVDGFPRLRLIAATQRDRLQSLGEPLLLAKVIAQQAFVVENNGTSTVWVDYGAVVISASSDLIAMTPEIS